MDFKLINTDYLETVSGGDSEIIKELVDIFRSQVVEFTAEMKSLLDQKDYVSLGMLAHKAKSSIAIMGMNDLATMLKTFELTAKAGQETEKYPGYISRFENETKAAVEELDKYISSK